MSAAAGPRILLVDDDADHRAALRAALVDEGYDIAEADDGRAAIDYLLASPAPSVVLLDLLMARVSGWDVLSVLRKDLRLRQIPVIVITGESARLQVPGVGVVAQIREAPCGYSSCSSCFGNTRSPACRPDRAIPTTESPSAQRPASQIPEQNLTIFLYSILSMRTLP